MGNTSVITKTLIQKALNYTEYRSLINELLAENRVTGDFMKNNDWMLEYTKQNNHRMDRGSTVFKATDALKETITSISEPWIWLVITEGWCGDAAQIIPAFVKMVDLNPKFSIKFILRDAHPKVMDAFLTNGSRAIPKLVVLNTNTLEVMGTWGPRPAVPQQMTEDYKNNADKNFDKYVEVLHNWYNEDRFESIQKELVECLK